MKTRVLFFGTPDIAVPSLEALHADNDLEIVGIGVFPDKKIGRKQVLMPCPVKEAALSFGLPLYELASKKDLESLFHTVECDVAIVIAFGMIFPESVLSIPPLGVMNVHFSLLPLYRGASPVQSALLHGDKISGITFQKMVKALDEGDILYQESFLIEGLATSEVFDLSATKTAHVLPNFITQKLQDVVPLSQDSTKATYCTKIQKKDGFVSPQAETAQSIYRKYRAYDLFPGIYMQTKKGILKLKKVSDVYVEGAYKMECKENTFLWILRAQLEGKKEMPIVDILRGAPDVFEG